MKTISRCVQVAQGKVPALNTVQDAFAEIAKMDRLIAFFPGTYALKVEAHAFQDGAVYIRLVRLEKVRFLGVLTRTARRNLAEASLSDSISTLLIKESALYGILREKFSGYSELMIV